MSHLFSHIVPKKGKQLFESQAFTTSSPRQELNQHITLSQCLTIIYKHCFYYLKKTVLLITLYTNMPCLFGMKQLFILVAISLLFNWPHIPSLDPGAFLHLKETPPKVSRVFFLCSNPELTSNFEARTSGGKPECRSNRSTLQGEQVETRISSGKRGTRATAGGKWNA